jgi:hypothetical protein
VLNAQLRGEEQPMEVLKPRGQTAALTLLEKEKEMKKIVYVKPRIVGTSSVHPC